MYNQEPFLDNNLVTPPPIYPHGAHKPDSNSQGSIAQNPLQEQVQDPNYNFHQYQWYHYPQNQRQGGYPGFYGSYEPFLAHNQEQELEESGSAAPVVQEVQEVQDPKEAVKSSQKPRTLKAAKPKIQRPLKPMNPYKRHGQPGCYKHGLVSSEVLNLPLEEDGENIITKNLAQRIIYEIQNRRLSQRVFAEQVIGKTQGHLSNILDHPGDWGNLLPAGRETWRQLLNWLQLCETDKSAVLHGIPLVCCEFQLEEEVSEPVEPAAKRQRTKYTKEQEKKFLEYFEKNRNPTRLEKEQLAAEMGLKFEQVKYYFTRLRRNR